MAKKVLGRGLGAYFPNLDEQENPENEGQTPPGLPPNTSAESARDRVNITLHIPVESIRMNPHQPRTDFDSFRLQELSDSIVQHGLIQPITVRHLGRDRYELISGERRLRATRMAGLPEIPAFVREADDEQMIVFALIENIQREELNPIELALGYQRLIDECSLTQEEVAQRVGRNRTTVTNQMRLLRLPAPIQHGLKTGKITAGHARTLINVEDPQKQEDLYNKTIENELSVRQLEELVRLIGKPSKNKSKQPVPQPDLEYREITNRLRRMLATKVDIRKKARGGEIKIEYYSDDELERLLHLFEGLHQST
ncbi:chromosome partitioning protein, ParB family [Cyclonatronum proteinivorum]|uniref:Chromosome partitioning protein, ParB family n=1 Tax=Cyclonatronum proteinivorum TaxID=1457365 RepID=A0A345UHP9_9BACT|nr:ParB/RepB/Spo0J family partition protein [Cyclonatronum proteinivorum]AXJ00001.1 chromosome partitioning protein, ParB family [Cyclonatronum proteinivorum]